MLNRITIAKNMIVSRYFGNAMLSAGLLTEYIK